MFVIKNAGSVHHIVLMYPFPQLFAATTVAFLHEWIASRTGPRVAVSTTVVITLLLVFGNVRSTAHQYAQILRYGSAAVWTDAIYPLGEYLIARKPERVLVLDWGIGSQLHFLSRNKMPQTGVPDVIENTAPATRLLEDWIDKPGILYVAYASDDLRVFPKTFGLFQEIAAGRGRDPRLEKTFEDRNGRPIFSVYSVMGTREEPKSP